MHNGQIFTIMTRLYTHRSCRRPPVRPCSRRPGPSSCRALRRRPTAPEPARHASPHAPLHSTGQYSPSNLSPYRFPSRCISCEHW